MLLEHFDKLLCKDHNGKITPGLSFWQNILSAKTNLSVIWQTLLGKVIMNLTKSMSKNDENKIIPLKVIKFTKYSYLLLIFVIFVKLLCQTDGRFVNVAYCDIWDFVMLMNFVKWKLYFIIMVKFIWQIIPK